MTARRWKLPAAVVAAVLIAEGAVWLLRPADRIEPRPVSATQVLRPAELDRAHDFRGPQRVLGLAALGAQAALLAALVIRPPRRAIRALERPARARVGLATALVGGGLALAVIAAALPFDAATHERAVDFGRSTQSWGGWAEDKLKTAAIAAGLAGAGAALLCALMRRFPRGWWLAGAGALVVVEVVFVWLAPVVLDPVFNRYSELPNGRTHVEVKELARKAGVDVGDVFVVDASRRTTAANAYVGGLGHTKRVVLYDTLLGRFTPDQTRLVVAHELGHVKHRDLARGMLWIALAAPGGMLVVMLLTRRWSLRAGTAPGTAASVPAAALALAAVAFAGTMISNQLSRAVEADADAYSLELTGEPREFVSMQRELARANLSDPDPPALYHFLFGTHPSAVDRVGVALAFGGRPSRPSGRSSAGAETAAAGADVPR
jgi:STE24 endopeptidase